MKVILRENLKNLGKIGEVVSVADGYARNYLLPKGLVMVATKGSVIVIEKEKASKKRKEDKLIKEMQDFAAKMNEKSYSIARKVGENDKLFGSVTTADIAQVLQEQGFDIDKKKILLDEPIHALGMFPVKVKLCHEVEAEIKVWVVKE